MTKDAAAENRQAWEKGDLKDCLELVRSAIAATIFYSKDADLKKSLQKTVNSINISLEAYGASLQPKEAEPTGEVELQAREKESAFLNEKINEKEAELLQAREEIEKLTQWKKEAMAVMPDFQEIGKLLNVPIGEQVSPHIIPKIKALLNSTTANTQPKEDVRDYGAMQDVPPEGLELYNAFQKRQKETQSELDKEEPIWAAESVLKTAKEIIDNVLSGGFEVDSDLCQHVLKHSLGLIDLSCECDSYNGYDCGCGGRWFVRQEAVKLLLNSEQGVQGCDASKAPSMGEPLANNSPKEEDVEKMAEEQTEILKWGKFEGGIAEHTAIKKAFIAGYNAAKTTK
jgi:hypothetical protein